MSAIAQFLNGKVLFVTGATGFLAKGLVEKVLRNAPGIKRIYLMVRPRRQASGECVSAQERMTREVWYSNAFANLRALLDDRFEAVMQEKLVAVAGDLREENLGIDPAEYARLSREVDVVVNCAATVVFDEQLDLALEQNTLGARRVVAFARACRDAICIHVSTAYVNGQRTGRVPETMLSPGQSVAEVIGNGKTPAPVYDLESEIVSIQKFREEVEAASRKPETREMFQRLLDRQDRGKRVTEFRRVHQLEALRCRWVKQQLVERGMLRARELGWNDSYTFTKAMGEQLIVRERGTLPLAIVRPSIIESSLSDPEPGWLDGLKVADPLIAHYSKGRLPDFPADPGIVIDVIPVDIVVNAILAALPEVRASREVQVYQVATGSQNPLRLGELFELIYEYFSQTPMRDRDGRPIPVRRWKFPSPGRFRRLCRLKYQIPLDSLKWLMDTLPFLPWSSDLRRRASIQGATLERVLSLIEIYGPYTNLSCEFETGNLRRLYGEMDAVDREVFNCDVSRIRWREYIQEIHIPGLKRHVLKTSEASL